MASLSPSLVRGVSKASLDALLEQRGPGPFSASARYDALARYEELPVRGSRGGRGWKHDLTKLDLSAIVPFAADSGAGDLSSEGNEAARQQGARIER